MLLQGEDAKGATGLARLQEDLQALTIELGTDEVEALSAPLP